MSRAWLGTQIDAVYHTSVVFNGIEYFFGAGVQSCSPGTTHHGRPMEIIPMGKTHLEMEIILEFLIELKSIYTPEVKTRHNYLNNSSNANGFAKSYDLFMHNCNNFSNDFCMFLVGEGIPEHITSLPQTVLNTPFGRMLKPQLDRSMREITQAAVPPSSIPPTTSQPSVMTNGSASTTNGYTNGNGVKQTSYPTGIVHNVTRLSELDTLLESAKKSCAVIFFTSATCPPCKLCYPAYEELAAEAGRKAVLIKVDLSQTLDIGARYRVRATPTFMTFLNGEKLDEWSGANPSQLLNNVRMLIQMAHPPHVLSTMSLPKLQGSHKKSVTYAKVPPLDKLITKLGPTGQDPSVIALKDFITTRTTSEAASAPLPNLSAISAFITSSLKTIPLDTLFPLIDLLRLAMVDPRVSGYFAAETPSLIENLLSFIVSLDTECPYALRITTLQLTCNLFTSHLFPPELVTKPAYTTPLLALVTSSLLDSTHPAVRVSAASLAFNIAAHNHLRRVDYEEQNALPEAAQVELVASIVEAISRESESKDVVRGLVLALGLLAYACETEGEVQDVLGALDAEAVVEGKREMLSGEEKDKELVEEVVKVMGALKVMGQS